MHNFKLLKKTPVRVISAILLFLIFTGIISWGLTYPFDRIYSNSNEYDLLFLGASETEWGINPVIIDEETGKNSYILATSAATLQARYEMLKYALEQKSLKTVVIEVSYFSFRKDFTDYELDKRVLYYSRISGFKNQFKEANENFSFQNDEFDKLYAEKIFEGINAWKKIAGGSYQTFSAYKGYDPQYNFIMDYYKPDMSKYLNSNKLITELRSENIAELKKIIDLCKENGATPVVITFPLSEMYIWQNDGWDSFHDTMLDLSDEYDFKYVDFNLLKNRSDYLSDLISYRDEEHLCDEGVTVFSSMISETLNALDKGDTVPFEFYDSYKETKEHSIYAENIENK